ncbi:hypothetical protein [Frigoribacterium sp. ACAM 257]|nr:hypothetical protein [Frigoribacterium sp. ACAM 257]
MTASTAPTHTATTPRVDGHHLLAETQPLDLAELFDSEALR